MSYGSRQGRGGHAASGTFEQSSADEFQIIDDEKLKQIDTPDEIEFNSTTRDVILVAVLFMIAYSVSLKQIHRYLHLKEYAARDIDERIIRTVTCHVCALSLTIAIFYVTILPLSMVSNELLLIAQGRPTSAWYLQWLSTELFGFIWKCLSICSIFSLFVLLPFCYFLLESEALTPSTVQVAASTNTNSPTLVKAKKTYEQDFRDRYVNYVQHLCSRFFQTCVIFLLFFAILALLTAIFSKIFGLLVDVFTLPVLFHEAYSFASVCLLLLSAPRGFRKMFEKVQELLENPTYLRKTGSLTLIQTQLDTLYRKMGSSFINDHDKGAISKEIQLLQTKLASLRKNVSFWKKVVYPIALVLLLALPVLSVLICSYHIFELIFQEQSRVFMRRAAAKESPWNILTIPKAWYFSVMGAIFSKKRAGLALGQHSLSFFGPLGTIVEAILVPYLYTSSMFGFYTLPVLKQLRPTLADTSLQAVIVNCVITLTMSSALPLLCRTLDFVEPHDTINPQKRGSSLVDENLTVVLGLNILFAVSTTFTILTYLNKNFMRMYRAFRFHFFSSSSDHVHYSGPGSPLFGSPSAIKSASQVSRRRSLGGDTTDFGTDCMSDASLQQDPIPTAMTSSVASLKFD